MSDKLPLHLEYRPQRFEDFVGNEAVVETLSEVISRDSRPRVYLFVGPSGCGKTTLARIIKNELGCSDRDWREFNSANTRGIDTIREIANSCMYSPMTGKYKIYLLDEVHKITGDGQHALLKLLEDTPKHVIFILCTTDPDKLISPLCNRCSTYQVKSLQRAKLTILLKKVCEKEKAEISIKVLNEVVRIAEGSPRRALVYLDQVINIDDEELALQTLVENVTGDVDVREICQLLLKGGEWKQVSALLKKLDQSPEDTRRQALGYFNAVLLNSQTNNRAADLISLFSESFIYSGKAGLSLACYLACG